jgi:3-oxoacyl-[acyl-carrier-protein] synthase II
MIGGSGAVEAIVSLIALRHRVIPPVTGLRTVDPDLDLDVVQAAPREQQTGCAVSNSFGFGGTNTSLVLAAAE